MKAGPGPKLEVGEGSIADAYRAGTLKCSKDSLKEVKTVVMLSENTELDEADAAVVAEALRALEETRQPKKPYLMVRELWRKLYARRLQCGRLTMDEARLRERKRIERVVEVVHQNCFMLSEVSLPYLNQEQRYELVSLLNEASKELRKFAKRLQTTGVKNAIEDTEKSASQRQRHHLDTGEGADHHLGSCSEN